jgi:hypothetical protein
VCREDVEEGDKVSYNIDNTTELVLNAYMDADDVLRIVEDHEDDLPEDCFLHDMVVEAEKATEDVVFCKSCKAQRKHTNAKFCSNCGKKYPTSSKPCRIKLPNFNWRCEGSGHSLLILKTTVAPLIRGEVQAIFTWEGGDSVSGIAVKDGRVLECDVVQSLELPKDW